MNRICLLLLVFGFTIIGVSDSYSAKKYQLGIVLPNIKQRLSISVFLTSSLTQKQSISKKLARSKIKSKKTTIWLATFSESAVKKSKYYCAVVNTKIVFYNIKGKLEKIRCWKIMRNQAKQVGIVLKLSRKK